MSKVGFDSIIGQNMAKKVLKKSVINQNPSHAYIFYGLKSTGKTTTALEYARALNCLDIKDGSSCGECANCRSQLNGNFPDIRVWSPIKKETTISQMREMRDDAVFKPVKGRWKVNIIEQADTLNEEAANCILKLLEDTPEYLVNILLSRNTSAVLPTIKSRCQQIRFSQVQADELKQKLIDDYNADEDEIDFIVAYSQGRPGIAISALNSNDIKELRDKISDIADKIINEDAWTALKLAEDIRANASEESEAEKGAREIVLDSLEMLLIWYRDLLSVKTAGESALVVNSDRKDNLISQSNGISQKKIENSIGYIMHAQKAIWNYAVPQMVTESLMIQLSS
ncbi:MAG: hypothetical protein SNJ70_04765 [Armatimonadota bacterium]